MKRYKFWILSIFIMLLSFPVKAQTEVDSSFISDTTTNLVDITKEIMELSFTPDTLLVTDDPYTVRVLVNPETGAIRNPKHIRSSLDTIVQHIIPNKHLNKEIIFLKPQESDHYEKSIYKTYRSNIPFNYAVDYKLPKEDSEFLIGEIRYYFSYLAIRTYE